MFILDPKVASRKGMFELLKHFKILATGLRNPLGIKYGDAK